MSKNLSIKRFATLVTPQQVYYRGSSGRETIIPIENLNSCEQLVYSVNEIESLIGNFRDAKSVKNLSRRLLEKLNETQDLSFEESRDLTKLLDYISKLFTNETYTETGEPHPEKDIYLNFAQKNILKPLAAINDRAKQKIQALLSPLLEKRLEELREKQTRLSQTIEGFKLNFQKAFSQAA